MSSHPVAHDLLGEAPERDELAPRPDRLRNRAERVSHENDGRVRRGLFEVLEQRVRRVGIEPMGIEEDVHAPIRLERPHVEVVVERPNLVDADHLPERLDHLQIRVGSLFDPSRVTEQ